MKKNRTASTPQRANIHYVYFTRHGTNVIFYSTNVELDHEEDAAYCNIFLVQKEMRRTKHFMRLALLIMIVLLVV
jgi:hypothetical protein